MSRKVLSGAEFKKLYPDITFVKLTNERENHNGFQFKTGVNRDHLPFNPEGVCQPGGIYICPSHLFYKWLSYNEKMFWFRIVTIPDNAQIYDESSDKVKVDHLILSERKSIDEGRDLWLQACKLDHGVLQCVPESLKDREMCLTACKQKGSALRYVPESLEDECLKVIQK